MGVVSDYIITRVVEGSLHVFVQMLLDDSYELQAQALNRDPRLLAAGISAIRFKPQGTFIVDGEFSSTPEPESASQPAVPTTPPAAEATAVPTTTPKARFWQLAKTLFNVMHKTYVKAIIYLVVLALAVNGLLCFLNSFYPQLNLPSLGMLSPAVTPTMLAANFAPTDLPTTTETSAPTLTSTQTLVADTATPPATDSQTPTDESLLATCNSQAYCRYGPSTAYLSYADIFVGDQVVIQGRYQYGGWIWVKPVGKNASCWIRRWISTSCRLSTIKSR